MKRAQVFIIKEFFSFLMGLILLISLSYIYINVLLPGIEELAYIYYSRNIIAQVDYILINVYNSVKLSGFSSTATFTAEMPKKVHESGYSVYFSANRSICVNIFQREASTLTKGKYVECRDHSLPHKDVSLTGTFLSETGKLQMKAVKKTNIIEIDLDKGDY